MTDTTTPMWRHRGWRPIYTCQHCQRYGVFNSHCRSCGDLFCPTCVQPFPDRRFVTFCAGLPGAKTSTIKLCPRCFRQARFRRFVILWAKFLGFCFQQCRMTALRQQPGTRGSYCVPDLRIQFRELGRNPYLHAAGQLWEQTFERVSNSRLIRQTQPSRVQCEASAMLVRTPVFDALHRTPRFQSMELPHLLNLPVHWYFIILQQAGRTNVWQSMVHHCGLDFLSTVAAFLSPEYQALILDYATTKHKVDTFVQHNVFLPAVLDSSPLFPWLQTAHHFFQKSPHFTPGTKIMHRQRFYRLQKCQTLLHPHHHKIQCTGLSQPIFNFTNIDERWLRWLAFRDPTNYLAHWNNLTILTDQTNVWTVDAQTTSTADCLCRASRASCVSVLAAATFCYFLAHQHSLAKAGFFQLDIHLVLDREHVLVPLSLSFDEVPTQHPVETGALSILAPVCETCITLLLDMGEEECQWLCRLLGRPNINCTMLRENVQFYVKNTARWFELLMKSKL